MLEFKIQEAETFIPKMENVVRGAYSIQTVRDQVLEIDHILDIKARITEREEKNSWEKMCPHGLY